MMMSSSIYISQYTACIIIYFLFAVDLNIDLEAIGEDDLLAKLSENIHNYYVTIYGFKPNRGSKYR